MYLSKEIQYLLLSLHFLSIAFSAQFFVSLVGLVSVVGLIDLDGVFSKPSGNLIVAPIFRF